MSTIQTMDLDKLSYNDLLSFITMISAILKDVTNEAVHASSEDFLEAADAYCKAVSNAPEILSQDVLLKDAEVDDAWMGIDTELENNLNHPNAEKRNASDKVYQIWSVFPDPTSMPYSEEYALMKDIIAALDQLPVELLKSACVDEWFAALKERYSDFMVNWLASSTAETLKQAEEIKSTREAVHEEFETLCAFLAAYIKIEDTEDMQMLFSNLNNLISQFNS